MSSGLAILGIGEDGVEGLGPSARGLIAQAALVVGGRRHLALAGALIRGRTMAWPTPMDDAFADILAARPAVVLASGDPFCFGIGTRLAGLVGPDNFLCIPAPSAFSLACARLGWTLQDTATISFCGRPLAALAPLLQPGRRVLALSAGAETPSAIAAYLRMRGFGPSRLHVMEALGGGRARVHSHGTDYCDECDPLNLVAIEVAAGPGAQIIPLAAGLADEAFEHDGQITKREIRAITLSALAPLRGERLWDIGCGSGSVGIEWMLRDPANTAIAIERSAARAARAMRNALALGVPGLDVRTDAAPSCLDGLPVPDAVFIGGGGQDRDLMAACWTALRPGGRLVVNAVTVETVAVIHDFQARLGGNLTRVAIERLDTIGTMHGFRPAMAVTQWAGDQAMIVAGIGCRRGCSAADIVAIVSQAAAQAGVTIDCLATPTAKLAEPGLVSAAAILGLPLHALDPEAILGAQPRCAGQSSRVLALVGVGAVAEAAALASAGPDSRLVLARIASATATCALAAAR